MATENPGILISFLVYLLLMVGIGFIFYRKTVNLSDYFLGGRGLNKWVTSLSAQASDMSGWLLLGLPGFAYLAGLESIWLAVGLAAGTYLNWKFVAKRLRNYTEVAGNSITLPDYFVNRFKTDNRLLRVTSALFILVFFLIYTASGFVAGAKLFNTVFDLNYTTALSTGVLVIIVYTFLGGFMAVAWTDFFQGLLMFAAIVAVPFFGVAAFGGPEATISALKNDNAALLNLFTDKFGEPLGWIAAVSMLAWGLGYYGQPHILVRFMAIRNPDQVKGARRIAMVWVLVSLSCAVLIGLIGNVIIPAELNEVESETVFMLSVEALVNPIFTGLILSAILAAVMSTADSQLLVTSSAITEDIYRANFNRNASDQQLLWVSRLAVIGVAAIAYFIALDPEASVLELVSYAWAGFGATFGPVIILSLYWSRMTQRGALAGILAGGLTVLIWKQINGGIFDLYEIVPGFIAGMVSVVIVSRYDRKPPAEVVQEFSEVVNLNR
jgi:sodium/proline symporter